MDSAELAARVQHYYHAAMHAEMDRRHWLPDDADHPMTAVFRNLSDDQLAYLATLTNEQRVEYINGVRDLDDEYLAATNTEPETP
jgi:hypothetical protein